MIISSREGLISRDCGGGGLRRDGGVRRIQKMRTTTSAKECGQNPKV